MKLCGAGNDRVEVGVEQKAPKMVHREDVNLGLILLRALPSKVPDIVIVLGNSHE